jgi:membrane protein YdbS with pleckstrin-like domain
MTIKLFLLRFYDAYNYIMDHNRNPLRHIPDPVARLWIMTVLAWMWCIAFGITIGSVVFMGISMVAHVAILFMVFFTASVFYDADRRHDSWLLNLRKLQKS